MATAVRVSNLVKRYSTDEGAVNAVREVSFNVEEGEFFTLLGPSGCGKSTTLRCIAGLEKADGGEIAIDDMIVVSSDGNGYVPAHQRPIGMVFQSYAIWPHMNVFDNVAFPISRGKGKLPKSQVRERVLEALSLVRLDGLENRPAPQLSGGQQQRLALARALVRQPKALLLDEPLSNLDAKLRTQMRTEIKKLHQKLQTTIIYVTHDQVEAMTLADRIIIMKDGYIEQIGSPIEVFNNPINVFVATFIGSPPMNILEADIVKKDGKIYFELDQDVLMPCPESKVSLLSQKNQVVIGIRSEDISPSNSNTSDEFWYFKKNIDLAEPLGTETQLFIKLKNKEIISRMYNPREIKIGEQINFAVNLNKIHIFDNETKKIIK